MTVHFHHRRVKLTVKGVLYSEVMNIGVVLIPTDSQGRYASLISGVPLMLRSSIKNVKLGCNPTFLLWRRVLRVDVFG